MAHHQEQCCEQHLHNIVLLLLFYDNLQALRRAGLAIHIILPHNANFLELQGSICLSSNMKVNTEYCRKASDLWSVGMSLPHRLVKCGALTAIKHKSTDYEAAQFYYYFSNLRIFLLGIEPPCLITYYSWLKLLLQHESAYGGITIS